MNMFKCYITVHTVNCNIRHVHNVGMYMYTLSPYATLCPLTPCSETNVHWSLGMHFLWEASRLSLRIGFVIIWAKDME